VEKLVPADLPGGGASPRDRGGKVSRGTSLPAAQSCVERLRTTFHCFFRLRILKYSSMLSGPGVRELLKPFAVALSEHQIEQVLTYLDLLLRWNQKINLTGIRTPQECVTRHFGESFIVSHAIPLAGTLLDVGSGAGFPGLALKIFRPELSATLLEPVGKKRAFLREVINTCRLTSIKVSGSTIEELSRQEQCEAFDLVTIRAVGKLRQLLPHAMNCLKANGHLCLWVGSEQAWEMMRTESLVEWIPPVPIPLSQKRQILVCKKL
jgi:16S rRNA (guanine527-N7)-methyltransferase